MEAVLESPAPMTEGINEPNVDVPMKTDPQKDSAVPAHIQKALKDIRTRLKEQYQPKRSVYLRRVTRAFEYFKNNPYTTVNASGDTYDTIDALLNGEDVSVTDPELYRANDNAYQMLGLAFIAVLSPDVPKTRFQPEDADDEKDLLIAKKASTIQADNERRNKARALQKLELLYHWLTGSYFCYTRNIIDSNRAGFTKRPKLEMQPMQILPDRYVCSVCGTTTPVEDLNPLAGEMCPKCGAPLTQAQFYEGYTANVPVKVGEVSEPNNMTAFDIYSGLNVDADPDASDLYESGMLDLEGEMNIAAVRAAYPAVFQQIQETATSGTSNTAGNQAREGREMVTNPGQGGSPRTRNKGTFSRCWIQPWAYYILDDLGLIAELQKLFPDGVKYVSYDNDLFLQAVPESLTQYWTWCGIIKGLGLYPFGVGDVAMDIQRRINNAANTEDAYSDRLAFGTILYDADVIDWDQVTSRPLTPGNGTPVNRTDDNGQDKSLQDLLWQPEFHVDPHLFDRVQNLIQLMQILTGVLPQSFGGSDPNVKTMGGQRQAWQTAMGRLKLFWDQIREEHAQRGENSVRCTIRNMGDRLRIVQKGETEGDWQTEVLLKSQLTGDFRAVYADSDDGFPASYQEIQDRIMELMGHMKDNPFLAAVLSDPDTQKTVASYILPEQIKLPNDAARTRIKLLIKECSENDPTIGPPGPDGAPILLPSSPLNPDFDDIPMAVQLTKTWLQSNAEMLDYEPDHFNNVLALLRQASLLQMAAAVKQTLAQQAATGGGGGVPGGNGEGGPGSQGPPPPPQ